MSKKDVIVETLIDENLLQKWRLAEEEFKSGRAKKFTDKESLLLYLDSL